MYKYYDKKRLIDIIKYSNGVKKVGGVIYLSKNKSYGGNVLGTIKDVAQTVGTIASVAIPIVKMLSCVELSWPTTLSVKGSELSSPRTLPREAITDEALNKVVNASVSFPGNETKELVKSGGELSSPRTLSGSGFYYI